MSRKVDESFFSEILDYQSSDAKKKLDGFSHQCSHKFFFQTEFMIGKFELVVVEEDKFEKGAK